MDPEAPPHTPCPRPGGSAPLAGRLVSRIGFGAMQLERAGDRGQAISILRQAVGSGVDHIDTAAFYGDCNSWIADALIGDRGYPDSLVLATKIGARRDPSGALVAAQRPEELRAEVEANLASLRTERLGVVYLRRVDSPPGIVASGEQIVDLDAQLAELIALRDAGSIGAIGLSAVSGEQLQRALPAGIACVQNLYGVLERAGEPLLELCRTHGVAWVPFFPLGSAFADRARATDDRTVQEIAAELTCMPAQVALAWLLAHDAGTLLIPGTSDPDHLRENLAVGDVRLTGAQMTRLDALGV